MTPKHFAAAHSAPSHLCDPDLREPRKRRGRRPRCPRPRHERATGTIAPLREAESTTSLLFGCCAPVARGRRRWRERSSSASALGSSGGTPPLNVARKVAVLGYRATGKTTLASAFVKGRFVEEYDPTIENTFTKKIRFKRAHFATEIIDAAGLDEYSRVSRNASVGVHGYLLVYACTSRSSFEKIRFINDAVLRVQGQSPGVVRVLVATMIDRRGRREVAHDEGQALADRWNIPFIECSAKESINVSEVFTTLIKEIEKDTGFVDAEHGPACAIL